MKMKKVWQIISIVLVIVLALGMTVFAEGGEAKIYAEEVSAKAGETVKVEIKVENNPGIVLAKLTVGYDNKLFKLVNVVDGGIWGEQLHSPGLDACPYKLYWLNATRESDIRESGVIATLEFEVSADVKPGSYPIVVAYDSANDDVLNYELEAVEFNTVNGSIVIDAENSVVDEEREMEAASRKKDVVALKINAGTAYAFGKTAAIDPDNSKVVPYLKNDRTLVPLRFVSETLGAEVQWENGWNYCYVVKGDKKIKITFNSADIEVNGQVVTYDAPVEVVQDRTMVPIRFISEQLGYDVKWNQANQLVIITPADNPWVVDGRAEADVLEGILVTFLFNGIF